MSADFGSHYHSGFGLRFRSEIVLPQLSTVEPSTTDVEIVYGEVPAELPEATERGVRFQAAPGLCLLQMDGIARFLVQHGKRIVIRRDPGAVDDDVRLFLLGPALGALLHQRGDLVLSGSAVDIGGESVVFLGVSGAGKSTLAIAFRQRGCAVLCDDLCIIRSGLSARPEVHPGIAEARLWPDSLEALGIDPAKLQQSRPSLQKRSLPLGAAFGASPLPIRKLYWLRLLNNERLALEAVPLPWKLSRLKRRPPYRLRFVADPERRVQQLNCIAAVEQTAPFTLLDRPGHSFRLQELADFIEADLQRI